MACKSCGGGGVKDKLRSIYDGWKHIVWSSKEVEAVAMERAKICSECALSKMSFCKQCGCYIPAKIRSMTEKCPINKWERWE